VGSTGGHLSIDDPQYFVLGKYHNVRLGKELEVWSKQSDMIKQVLKALREMGDPFAIDALYCASRDEPELKEFLMSDITIR
jgi:hypothetical protein